MKLNINKDSTLHTLNASPFEHRVLFDRLIRFATPGDSLLLMENGVYTITNDYCLTTIRATGIALYCLQHDILARGLQHLPVLTDEIAGTPKENRIYLIDDTTFVDISCKHHKIVSWFQ